jgi:Cu/Ag efflux protein CusF
VFEPHWIKQPSQKQNDQRRQLKEEKTMRIMIMAAGVALVISSAWAQEMSKGTVKNIDQPKSTVTIQQATATKVGANDEAAPTDDFKVQDGSLFSAFTLGDKVSFTVETINGVKTITKIQKE